MIIIKTNHSVPFFVFSLLTSLLINTISAIELTNHNNANPLLNLFTKYKLGSENNLVGNNVSFVLEREYIG
jgi:hypothetical protein